MDKKTTKPVYVNVTICPDTSLKSPIVTEGVHIMTQGVESYQLIWIDYAVNPFIAGHISGGEDALGTGLQAWYKPIQRMKKRLINMDILIAEEAIAAAIVEELLDKNLYKDFMKRHYYPPDDVYNYGRVKTYDWCIRNLINSIVGEEHYDTTMSDDGYEVITTHKSGKKVSLCEYKLNDKSDFVNMAIPVTSPKELLVWLGTNMMLYRK